MLSRLLVILLGAPLFIYIILFGKLSFLGLTLIMILISLFEFNSIIRNKSYSMYLKLSIFLGLIYPIYIYYMISNNLDFKIDTGLIIVLSIFLIGIYQIKKEKIKNSINELTLTLFSVIYIPFFLTYIILIRDSLNNGLIILLFSILNIWAADTFAYLFGISIGGFFFKFKLSEKISPKKSIEGLIGGFVGVILTTYFFEIMLKYFKNFNSYIIFEKYNNQKIFLLAILILVFSVMGDLFESKIKREFSVKDSGKILLGHGGVLDRIDSMLFVLPLVYYFVKYLN